MSNNRKSRFGSPKKEAKIIQKRTTVLQKFAYMFRPFVLYMLVKSAAMFLLAALVSVFPAAGIAEFARTYSGQLSAVINGMASVAAVCFVLNDFLVEVDIAGEVDIDKGIPGQLIHYFRTGFFDNARGGGKKSGAQKAAGFAFCIVAGILSSYVLNVVIARVTEMLQKQNLLGSSRYVEVERIQYSVPVWLGLVLYGLVSPMVEEMVFRGITYSRIRRFYGVPKAAILSALLFGGFHANLPQFAYGSLMGVVIALCYERIGCFAAPVLVHMSANIFVFLVSACG